MCVIVHQPRGAHLEKDRARRLWLKNSDGGGFSFIDNTGTIQTERYMGFNEYWKAFETARSQFPHRDYLLHMRIATHGKINLSNVHPFHVDEHTVMAHNGIIHSVPVCDKGRSDTRVFIEEVLPRLPETWLDDEYLVDMVDGWIGWSKLMFLTTNPKLSENVYILGKKSGVERDGMWFSNSSGVDEQKYPTNLSGYQYKSGKYKPLKSVSKPKETVPLAKTWDGYELTDDGFWQPAEEDKVVADAVDKIVNEAFTDRHTIIDLTEDDMRFEATTMYRQTSFTIAEERKELERRRLTNWLGKKIDYDLERDSWFCWGCDEFIDDKSGECDCLSKVCIPCERFLINCSCMPYTLEMKYSENAPLAVLQNALDNLVNPAEVLDAETTEEVDDRAVETGDGNTADNEDVIV